MEFKIKNNQKEIFVKNLEKGFMVSNGVYVDNFINRKLGRVGLPYKKGESKEEEERVGAPGPLSRNKKLAKQAAKYREKEAKAYDKIRKDVGKNISDVIEGVKNDDESKGVGIMENKLHDGLREAKMKYGFKECYVLPIRTKKGETVVAYAAKDKKGDISYFMSEKDLMENTTTTSYGAKNKEGSGGLSEGMFKASVLRKIKEGKTEEQEQKKKDKKEPEGDDIMKEMEKLRGAQKDSIEKLDKLKWTIKKSDKFRTRNGHPATDRISINIERPEGPNSDNFTKMIDNIYIDTPRGRIYDIGEGRYAIPHPEYEEGKNYGISQYRNVDAKGAADFLDGKDFYDISSESYHRGEKYNKLSEKWTKYLNDSLREHNEKAMKIQKEKHNPFK